MSIPPWMEDVAGAGGFEEHAQLKAQKELMEKMEKIPPEKFLQLNNMLGSLERMFDTAGSDLGILGGLKDSITDTIQTEFDAATAEFKNSFNTIINTALEPFMPLIQAGLNGITTMLSRGMGAIEALITGKFDQYIKNLKLELQDQVDDFQKRFTEGFWGSPYGRNLIEQKYDLDLDALEQSALEGGVYSGQFDINIDQLAGMLENLNIPTFDFEEG